MYAFSLSYKDIPYSVDKCESKGGNKIGGSSNLATDERQPCIPLKVWRRHTYSIG